jgi:hypothetical protein
MNIAIITICTGKYTLFFDGLYKSCKEHFIKEAYKGFFVFTDGEIQKQDDIIRVEQKKLGWPFDTMMRFHMFNRIEPLLTEYDYIFFMNANMLVVDEITSDILPTKENDYLVGVDHPGFTGRDPKFYTYEKNPISNFFIKDGEGKHYFQGCLNGGRSNEFLSMSKELEYLMNEDLQKRHIPLWHDESALNWYFSKRNPKLLAPSYAYPDVADPPYEKKILQLDKNKFGGHDYLRS